MVISALSPDGDDALLLPKRVEKIILMKARIPPSGAVFVGTGVVFNGADTGDTGISFFTGTGLVIVTGSAT
jgi:hypothetical protein